MRILIAGGSGFVGRAVVGSFCADHKFINISLKRKNDLADTNVLLDLSKPLDFLHFDEPIDLIINCVECRHEDEEDSRERRIAYIESVRHLLDFAARNKIERFIHFSVNHINAVENDYQQAKFVSEGLVKKSGLKYIIFKPTIIFGENSYLDYLLGEIAKDPVLLNFWNVDSLIAPIHISDVLANVRYALSGDARWNDAYPLLGPEILSFDRVISRRADFGRLKTPPFSKRAAEKKAEQIPARLKVLFDWVNADDTLCRGKPPLEAREYYNE